jgi:hypothetical protein
MNTDTNSIVIATATVKTSKRGRPAANLKLILNKSFTLKDLQSLNPDVKFVTIRAAVLRGLDTGKFTKLNRNVRSGKKGKPASIFINTKVYNANLSNLAKSKVVVNVNDNQPVVA